jgi:hypothetical protein
MSFISIKKSGKDYKLAGFGVTNVHEHIEPIRCVPKLLEAMRRNHVVNRPAVTTIASPPFSL